MTTLLLLAASLLPPVEVRTFAHVGDVPHELGRGVLIAGQDWQASVYVDGDYDAVTTVYYRGKVWHRTWTR